MVGIGGIASVLKKRPFLANAITTSLLFGTGDALAQVLFSQEEEDGNKGLVKKTKSSYDYMRTLRSMVYGGIIFAPIGFKWYSFLDSLKLSAKFKPNLMKNTIYRVMVDQLIWAPVGIPLYFTCMTIMEGGKLQEINDKLTKNWWITLKTNWVFWPAFQLVNFGLVPLHLRLLSVNIVSIFWNCLLSYRNSMKKKEESKSPTYSPPVPE